VFDQGDLGESRSDVPRVWPSLAIATALYDQWHQLGRGHLPLLVISGPGMRYYVLKYYIFTIIYINYYSMLFSHCYLLEKKMSYYTYDSN